MNFGGAPSQHSGAGVEQHLHQAQHADVVEFDAGGLAALAWDRQREALEQREINMHVERLGFERGKAVGDAGEDAAHLIEMVETLVEPEVLEIVTERLQTQEGRELFIHSHDGILSVGPQHMVAMLGSLQHAVQLAAHPLVQTPAEDLRNAVSAEPQQPDVTGALEQLVNGEVAPEDQVAAVLDLLQ